MLVEGRIETSAFHVNFSFQVIVGLDTGFALLDQRIVFETSFWQAAEAFRNHR